MVDGLLDALSTKFANASAELYAKSEFGEVEIN